MSSRQTTRRQASTVRSRITVVVMLWLGIAMLMYPQTAGWFSQVNQSQVGDDYGRQVDLKDEAERTAVLEAAKKYNETLKHGEAYDPFTLGMETSSPAYQDYTAQLEGVPTGVMARLRIPAIEVKLPIFHGTTEEALSRGVGHLYGTSLPVGGQPSHSVLTAHSGLADAVLFTHLDRLKVGDRIMIDVYGETLTYEMTSRDIVLPSETESLRIQQSKDMLTLVTCTPIALNTHRLLVHAERVDVPASEASQELPEIPGFPWWAVVFGVAMVAGVGYVLLGTRRHRSAQGAR